MKKKFINTPEESQIEDVNYWIQKMSDVNNYLLEEARVEQKRSYYNYDFGLTKKKKPKKKKEKKDFQLFEFAPKSILTNEDLMLKAVDESFIHFFHLDESLRENKSFVLRYLNELKYSYYFCLSENLLMDEEIFKICLKKDEKTYTSLTYKMNLHKFYGKEKGLEFLDINPKVYEHFSSNLKDDMDIAQKAIALDLNNAAHMKKSISAKIFKNKEIATTLLNKSFDFFEKVNNKLRDDEEFMGFAVNGRPSLIEFASQRLREKKEFVQKAATAYNLLRFIPEKFKKDPDLMRDHIGHNPTSYMEIAKYQDVKPLLLHHLKKQYFVYDYLSDDMKKDPDYLYFVLQYDGFYKKDDAFSFYQTKTPMIQIIPKDLQRELTEECNAEYPIKEIFRMSDRDRELEVLSYARKKYTNMYLTTHLPNETEKKKKLKL